MLQKIESIVNIAGVIINLYFVFLVYNLSERDTNPKVSFNPKIEDFSILNKGIPFELREDMTREEKKEQKKMFKYSKEWSENGILFDDDVYWGKINFNLSGFPEENHDNMMWVLNIDNKGEFPAINLTIKIELVIKRVKFDIGIDKADIINPRFVDYKKIRKTIKIDYLPSLHSKRVKLLKLFGDFIEADLYIIKAYSEEMIYIEKPIKIDTYTHQGYLDGFEDSPHYRRILGAFEKVENTGEWNNEK